MERIAENIYVETTYEGVNVGAIITTQGIIAIDTPTYPRQARDWAMRLQSMAARPVIYTILTDYHSDRILNTRWLNAPVIAHQVTADKLVCYDKRYPANLLENMAARNPYRSRELASSVVEKAAISFTQSLHLHKGGVHIVLLAAPGPTAGNLWVYLPEKGILFTGDTFNHGQHPLLLEPISSQWLATLERLDTWPESLRTIVPGRGVVQTETNVSAVSGYLERMQLCMKGHVEGGQLRDETAVHVPEFLAMFPVDNLPIEWLRQQIRISLDHVYDEIQLAGQPNNRPVQRNPAAQNKL